MPLLETIGSGAARAFGLTSFARLSDQYFNRTTLLISANGTNGSTNNTFLDYSSDSVSLTKLGNTAPGSFHPFLTNYSVYYDNSTSDGFFIPSNSAFAVGTGNFTIECWVFPQNKTDGSQRIMLQGQSGTTELGIDFDNGTINIPIKTSNKISYNWSSVELNKWHHLAVVRSGTGANQLKLYINGVEVASGTSSDNIGAYNIHIGSINWASDYNFRGYIYGFRYSNVARSISIPTTKYSSDGNTLLLVNQQYRFKDESSYNHAISLYGSPSIASESPFKLSGPYLNSEGLSYYFDGSGDAIQLGTNSVQDPVFISWLNNNQARVGTIEAWIYPTALASGDNTAYEHPSIFNKGQVFWNWGIRGNTTSAGSQIGQFRFYWYDGAQNWINSTVNVKINEWTHIASVVNGSSVKLYINGVDVTGSYYRDGNLQGSLNFTGIHTPANFAQGSEHYMGRVGSNISHSNWQGYISNFRVVAGTQVYTANFTPPTSPLSNISNTRLLLKAENTAIVDATRNNNLETVGDAKISTAVSKFGGSSLVFDGSGDLIFTSDSPLRNIGTSDFTVEGWFYPTTWAVQYYYRRLWYIGSALGNDFCLNLDTNGTVQYRNNDTVILTSSSVLPLNSWTHVALCRNNGTTSMYFNGVFVGSTGTNNNLSSAASNKLALGNLANPADRQGTFQGYIDDFRVSRLARYTGAFTAPTREFETS